MNLITQVRARRDALKADLKNILDRVEREGRSSLTLDEDRDFERISSEIRQLNERIDELVDNAVREAKADESRAAQTGRGSGWTVTGEPATYRDPAKDPTSPSFFRDLRNARLGDANAAERLRRNEQERAMERRAGDLASSSSTTGGTFAPPAWLVEDFVALARPGRPTADLLHREELPAGVSSINLPRVKTGTTTAVQASQNTAVSDTAATTDSVSSGIVTVAGKQIVAQQMIDQSGIPFDRVVLGDLAADYAKEVDLQVIAGSGASGQLKGLRLGTGQNAISYTSAAPKVTSTTNADSFYSAVVRAINAVAVNRFAPASHIVMHPTRWAWVLEALDSQARPLVVPDGPQFNGLGIAANTAAAQGAAGTFAGLPVVLDPNIATNYGAGTNQDEVYVTRSADLYLWESAMRMESFDATYADQASVLFRVLGYAAAIPDRYGPSVSVIAGTGLVAPTL